MKYAKEINDVSVVDYDGDDAYASNFFFRFRINFEQRDWGIKTISLYDIKLLSGSVFVINAETKTEIDCKDFDIENNVLIDSDCVTINDVQVNVKDKTIYVS